MLKQTKKRGTPRACDPVQQLPRRGELEEDTGTNCPTAQSGGHCGGIVQKSKRGAGQNRAAAFVKILGAGGTGRVRCLLISAGNGADFEVANSPALSERSPPFGNRGGAEREKATAEILRGGFCVNLSTPRIPAFCSAGRWEWWRRRPWRSPAGPRGASAPPCTWR